MKLQRITGWEKGVKENVIRNKNNSFFVFSVSYSSPEYCNDFVRLSVCPSFICQSRNYIQYRYEDSS